MKGGWLLGSSREEKGGNDKREKAEGWRKFVRRERKLVIRQSKIKGGVVILVRKGSAESFRGLFLGWQKERTKG